MNNEKEKLELKTKLLEEINKLIDDSLKVRECFENAYNEVAEKVYVKKK